MTRTRTIEVQGATIALDDAGDGPAVLLLDCPVEAASALRDFLALPP